MQIAVDGPAGSGKSTVAKEVAMKKNIVYLDTGAMYRAVTLKLINSNTKFNDLNAIKNILSSMTIDFKGARILLDGMDVSEEIRSQIVNDNVSAVASIGIVRQSMVEKQQEIAKNQSIIMDGRDIGTKVLPNAELKIFLTASIKERAMRRFNEMKEKGQEVDFDEICKSIESRDHKDMTRSESPLVKADDAVEIDTTGLDIQKVVSLVIEKIDKVSQI